jgi:hypothetical protein
VSVDNGNTALTAVKCPACQRTLAKHAPACAFQADLAVQVEADKDWARRHRGEVSIRTTAAAEHLVWRLYGHRGCPTLLAVWASEDGTLYREVVAVAA